jgi:hypothetical protein
MPPLLDDKDGVSINIHGREHLPPHVHACYGEYEALVDIRTGRMFEGYVPNKKLKVVQEWLAEGENRTRAEENFYVLNPRHRPKKVELKNNKKGGK